MSQMRRAIVRTLWGDQTIPRSITKIRKDVRDSLLPSLQVQSGVNVVFGVENARFLSSLGLKVTLIDQREVLWPENRMWRHKLEAWRVAMEQLDEMVFLDWDVRLVRPLSEDFWDQLGRKACLQGCLFQYKNPQAPWRETDWRKVPSAACVYIRGRETVEALIELWNGSQEWREEICMAAYCDGLMDGWKGVDEYVRQFEPTVCSLRRKSAVPESVNAAKSVYFAI
jgi:hypothetical protein